MVNVSRMVAPIWFIAIPIAFPERMRILICSIFWGRLCPWYISLPFSSFHQVRCLRLSIKSTVSRTVSGQTVERTFADLAQIDSFLYRSHHYYKHSWSIRARWSCWPDWSVCRYSMLVSKIVSWDFLRHSAFCQQYAEGGRLDHHAEIWCGRYSDK